MACDVFILDGAKCDYLEIKRYIIYNFGTIIWKTTEQKYKSAIKDISEFPFSGFIPPEATLLGLQNIRERLVGKTRIIYEVKNEAVYVHMFISTHRDFMTMLTDRLLRC